MGERCHAKLSCRQPINDEAHWGIGTNFDIRTPNRIVRCSGGISALLMSITAAARPNGLSRQEICDDLWGSSAASSAIRSRLRNLIWRTRQITTDTDLIDVASDRIRLSRSLRVDFLSTPSDVNSAMRRSPIVICYRCRMTLTTAIPHSRVATPLSSHVSEQWNTIRIKALNELGNRCLENGDWLSCLKFSDDVIGIDDLSEPAWTTKVLALARSGNSLEAARCHRRFRTIVRRRLGIDPGPGFQRTLDELRRQYSAEL